jgi:hypothetical protein
MNITRLASIPFVAVVAIASTQTAAADAKADRATIAETLTKLSTSAATLAKTAKESDDRGARKKFGPAASDLSDDLGALARRLGKDVAIKTIATDAASLDKDASALVELADEVEDKDERKTLRAQASLIQQGIANARKAIDAVKEGTAAAPSAPVRFTGRVFNTSDADNCSFGENLKFVISRGGQQVYATQNVVFPGKDFALVLDKGSYLVQLLDTSGEFMAQRTLEVGREGWSFKSGCVHTD